MQLRLSGSSVDTENEAEKIQQELERMLADRQAKLGMPGIAVYRQRLVSLLGESSNNLKRFDQTIIDCFSDRIIGNEGLFGPDFSKVAELLSSPDKNVPGLHAQICSIRLEPLFRDMPAL